MDHRASRSKDPRESGQVPTFCSQASLQLENRQIFTMNSDAEFDIADLDLRNIAEALIDRVPGGLPAIPTWRPTGRSQSLSPSACYCH
jgi:hypothetical protein